MGPGPNTPEKERNSRREKRLVEMGNFLGYSSSRPLEGRNKARCHFSSGADDRGVHMQSQGNGVTGRLIKKKDKSPVLCWGGGGGGGGGPRRNFWKK